MDKRPKTKSSSSSSWSAISRANTKPNNTVGRDIMISNGKAQQSSIKCKSTSALPKNIPRSKKDNYSVVSKNSLLTDIKNTALNGLVTVKERIHSLSGIIKPLKKSKSSLENYGPMENQATPVKMYSPFTFESPEHSKLSSEEKLKLRQQLFTSPTNKIKEDMCKLESGIDELNQLSEKYQNYQSLYPQIRPTHSQSASTLATTSNLLMFEDDDLFCTNLK